MGVLGTEDHEFCFSKIQYHGSNMEDSKTKEFMGEVIFALILELELVQLKYEPDCKNVNIYFSHHLTRTTKKFIAVFFPLYLEIKTQFY